MRHDPGLAASPPVRYMLEVERSGYSPFPLIVRCGRTISFFALFSEVGSNVVESAAILMELAAGVPGTRPGVAIHPEWAWDGLG
jgi:hypothetical protein